MQVILNKNLHRVGKKNDLVEVAHGYARNYLIPAKIALEATHGARKHVLELRRQTAHKSELLKKEAGDLAKRISNIKLEIKAKAGALGKVFGAISPAKISEVLGEQGIYVDRHSILIKTPIKEIGNHIVKLKLHDEIECDLVLSVMPS